VFALYSKPGMELQAFGALTGFGAALLKFTGQKGVMINFVHRHAGTAKLQFYVWLIVYAGTQKNFSVLWMIRK
jgi:hypothetical protein